MAQVVCARELTLAPLALENQRSNLERTQPLADFLGEHFDLDVRVFQHPDYAVLIDAFVAGDIDLIEFGPLPYLALRERAPWAVPLVSQREPDGEPHYHCVLAAPLDGYKRAEDIRQNWTKRTRVGLTQPLSTCGLLSTAWLLQQIGRPRGEYRVGYLGNHEAVARELALGTLALGGVRQQYAERFASLGVRQLAQTPPLPGFVLVANNRTIDSTLMERMRQGLLRMDPNAYPDAVIGRYGFAPVYEAGYRQLQQMMGELGMQIGDFQAVAHE